MNEFIEVDFPYSESPFHCSSSSVNISRKQPQPPTLASLPFCYWPAPNSLWQEKTFSTVALSASLSFPRPAWQHPPDSHGARGGQQVPEPQRRLQMPLRKQSSIRLQSPAIWDELYTEEGMWFVQQGDTSTAHRTPHPYINGKDGQYKYPPAPDCHQSVIANQRLLPEPYSSTWPAPEAELRMTGVRQSVIKLPWDGLLGVRIVASVYPRKDAMHPRSDMTWKLQPLDVSRAEFLSTHDWYSPEGRTVLCSEYRWKWHHPDRGEN